VLVKDRIRPLPGGRRLSQLRHQAAFGGSAQYWERRYGRGGTSGASHDALALGKAVFPNDLVWTLEIGSVIEFGCSDGNQLSLTRAAIQWCQHRFAAHPARAFFLYDGAYFTEWADAFTANLAISIDTIYPLTEDEVFEIYLTHLFGAATKYVIICTTNRERRGSAPHVRHRHFTPRVQAHQPDWRLVEVTKGRTPGPSARISSPTSACQGLIWSARSGIEEAA
jgi:hypothetical protein